MDWLPGGKGVARLGEGSVENGGDLPLCRIEVAVAGTHGEAVGFAHGGAGDDPDRHLEIRNHAPDDDELLIVLFSKNGVIGPDQIKEHSDDGGNAPEEGGAGLPTQDLIDVGDLDPGDGVEPVGVEVTGVRKEEEVRADRLEFGDVIFQGAGIGLKVFPGAELEGIDEDADDGERGELSGLRNEGDMTGMEVAHGGHEGDFLPLGARALENAPEFPDAMDDLHHLNSCSGPGNSMDLTART